MRPPSLHLDRALAVLPLLEPHEGGVINACEYLPCAAVVQTSLILGASLLGGRPWRRRNLPTPPHKLPTGARYLSHLLNAARTLVALVALVAGP